MEAINKVLTLKEMTEDLASSTSYGNAKLDDGDAYAWSEEKPRSWVFDLPDMSRQIEVDKTLVADWLNPPEKNQTLTDIKGGIKSVGTQGKDALLGLGLLGVKFTSPLMKQDEAKMLLNSVGRYLVSRREQQQSLLQSEGINPESFAFGATNAIGQAVMTTIAGIATGGSALPIALGVAQTVGSKESEYATTFAERGGDLSQQPKKDDWIALGLGAVEGLLDRGIGAERIFSQVVKKGLGKEALKATVGEALEEGLQEPIEYLGNTVAGYEDRTYGELMKDSLKSAVFGALAGGTMGTGMYMVHRSKLQKFYEDMGYEPNEAKQKAIDTIDTGKTEVLREAKTRAELKLQFGDSYTALENKIKAQIEATGSPENVKGDLDSYVQTVTRTFANQILNIASIKGVSANEVLDISDIEQYGTTLRLNTPDMKDEVSLRKQIADKKEKARVLKENIGRKKAEKLGVTGATDEETAINLKINSLEKQLTKVTDDIELADKTAQVKTLKDQITQIKAEKAGLEADTQRETALNLQIKALEKRLERIKDNSDIADRKAQKQGLPKAKTHALQAIKDSKNIKSGVNAKNFINELGKADVKKLTNADGSINNVAVQRRYNDAVLASVINDPRLFERLILAGNLDTVIQDRVVKNIEAINQFNTDYSEYALNEDLKEALGFLEDTNIENFAEKSVQSDTENTFGGITMAYVMLHSNNNYDLTQFINSYKDNIEIYKSKGNPLTIKNDILAETLKYNPLTASKFDAEGITTDKNLLSVYANVNNIRQSDGMFNTDNLEPDTSGIYPVIRKEAEAIKATLKDTFMSRMTEKGKSLTTFIRDLGGIYDFGGELAARGIKADIAKKSQTNKDGKRYVSLDYLLEKAFDAGYFPEKESAQDITNDEMIEAIEKDYFGEKVRPSSKSKENDKINNNLAYIENLDRAGINAKDSVEEIAVKLQQYYIDNDLPLSNMITAEDIPDYIKNITLNGFELYQQQVNASTQSLDEIVKSITDSGIKLNLTLKDNIINISRIIVPKDKINNGLGTKAMQSIIRFADMNNNIIALTPSADFGSNLTRLKEFYKRLGFIENKGKNKDFTTQESFIRNPKNTEISQTISNIYNQRKRVNASYNINTKEIILGKNFNSMSLPHEMSHFWLDYLFNDVNLWREGGQRSGLYLNEIGGLWEFLGISDNQKKLTRDQQERFATLTEQYLTQRTALPIGTEFAVKDYLEYVPNAYNTFLDFGYVDSKGKVQNPIMTKEVKEWFDRFFTNWTIPDSPAPELVSVYVPSEEPATDKVQTERATDIESTAAKEKSFTESIIKAVDDNVAVADKIDMAVKAKNYQQEANDILLPPETTKEDKFSFVRFGRGTNTKEAMSKEAVKWVKSNKDKALEIAMGDPRYVENDSPIERGMLIRAVMEANPTLKDTLKINFALTKSLSGKTLGLNNDTSDSLFLIGLGKAENNYLNKYLLKRYGKKSNSGEKLERELDKFVSGFAPKIINADKAQVAAEIKLMLAEASKIFGQTGTQESLFQTDIPSSVLKDRNKFIDFAKQLVRKHVGALPSDDYTYNLMTLATRAQIAAPDLNSDDVNTAVAAAKEIREYQNYLIQSEIPLTIMDKIIGGFASRAMLSGISTHLKNLISNSLEIPQVRIALSAKYGKSEVSESLIRAEADRMTRIYEETLISLPQMHTLNDRSLIAGEIYRIANTNSVTIGGVKINTIGNTSIPDPLALLGRSDFFFRRIAYLQTLAHIATYEAKKTGKSPDELFMQYKQIGGKESSDSRLEAILVSNIAVFTHNGELSRVIGSIRRTLDDYTAGAIGANQFGLGTVVSPFVKTPSNILQLGAEAIASPFVVAKKKIKGEEIGIKTYIDVAHLVSAVTLAAVILAAGCDYEPPYKVGNKYDSKKHYDSIKIGNVWIKIDLLGTLAMPLRLMVSAKDSKKWAQAVEGSIGELPLDFGGLTYALTKPDKGTPYFVESQLNKLIPSATSIFRPFVRESGLTMPTYGKIGSQFARRLGLDGKDATVNDYIHILLSSVSVEE